MANKKKLPVSIFELVWYIVCALVIIWGLVYVILSAIDKYNDLDGLHKFAGDFKTTFGLSLYFWGLIIIGIGIVAGVTVMIIYAKTFDKAADREQRRSARLSAAFKKESPVVDEQKAEVVDAMPAPQQVEEQPAEQPQEEPAKEQPVEEAKEEPASEIKEEVEEAPVEEAPMEAAEEEKEPAE